jgi:hypothetical protein
MKKKKPMNPNKFFDKVVLNKWQLSFLFAFLILLIILPVVVYFAAPTTNVQLTVNAGTLTTDILDENRTPVSSPLVTLSAKNFSFDCYTSATGPAGTLGSNTQRLYVINGSAANNGWSLTIGATGGATSLWSDGSNNLDFNDSAGGSAGCADGGDADTRGGQLNVDPSVSTLTSDCNLCSNTGITKGSSSAFVQSVTDSITILNAAAGSDDVWRGYVTGVSMAQTLPGEQPAGTYTLNLTLTVTAL